MPIQLDINDVSQTAFLTLQCHAMDAKSNKPLLNDPSAQQTLDRLKEGTSGDANREFFQRLAQDKVSANLVVHSALRSKYYDQCVRDFVRLHPQATVVNIGCGLDHRFERVDNGQLTFIDLDLPDLMAIKSQLFPPQGRYHQVAQSVFDFSWMDQIKQGPMILVAEGVFMYCREDDVKSLFRTLADRFPGSEMLCEVFSSKWLTGWRKRAMESKLQRELKLGPGTTFQFGIPKSEAMEAWRPEIKLIDDWSYFDSEELESPVMKWLGRFPRFRQVQWTVRYRLGS